MKLNKQLIFIIQLKIVKRNKSYICCNLYNCCYITTIFVTSIAITFASKLTKPIINLIGASDSISKGALDVKVPELETDDEFKQLNRNFNSMIERLKEQQDKLLITERYEA